MVILQTSGSLYGALIGSVLAFKVADFLGLFCCVVVLKKKSLIIKLASYLMIYMNEGRRRELISSALFYLIGAIVTTMAPNFPVMVVGRFVYGIGIGLVMA